MSTTTEYDTADPAITLANDPTTPTDVASRVLRRKGWLASLLLRGTTRCPLPSFYHRLLALPPRIRRRQSPKIAAALVGAALLFASIQIPAAHAATITVDGARCTLVDAIRAANTDAAVGRFTAHAARTARRARAALPGLAGRSSGSAAAGRTAPVAATT